MTRIQYDDVTLPDVGTASVSIDVEGPDEDVAEKVALHTRNEAVRALQAFEEGKPPHECDGTGVSVAWGRVLGDE